jgi:hypothetical protein
MGKICPGYRQEEDLLFHNADAETFTAMVARNQSKETSKVPRTESGESSGVNSVSPRMLPSDVTNSRYVSLVLNLFSIETDSGRLYGPLELLPTLIDQASEDSCLKLAIKAFAGAYASNQRGDSSIDHKAALAYGRALKSTNKALQDPQQQTQDSTLLTVWLLSVYEVSGSTTPSLPSLCEGI